MSTTKLAWILGGICATLMLFVLGGGILVAALLLQPSVHGKKIGLKGGSELYYTQQVTEADGQKLAKFLNENIIKEDSRPATYQLTKENGKWQVRVVIQNGKENEAELPLLAMGYLISMQVLDNEPLEIHLCDDHLKTVKVIEIKAKEKA